MEKYFDLFISGIYVKLLLQGEDFSQHTGLTALSVSMPYVGSFLIQQQG